MNKKINVTRLFILIWILVGAICVMAPVTAQPKTPKKADQAAVAKVYVTDQPVIRQIR